MGFRSKMIPVLSHFDCSSNLLTFFGQWALEVWITRDDQDPDIWNRYPYPRYPHLQRNPVMSGIGPYPASTCGSTQRIMTINGLPISE